MITSVMIDNREPDWLKKAVFSCPSIVTSLNAGDIWAACDDDTLIVVERKTGDDLLHSIADGRLFDQCKRIKDTSPWAYLVITGHIASTGTGYAVVDGEPTQWRFDAVQGALLTVQEIGVGVVYARGDADFVSAVHRLGQRSHNILRVKPHRDAQFWSDGQAMLLALPGIGDDRIQKLLKHTGTPAWALSWLTVINESGVPGIGVRTKRAIRKALELKDNEELHIYVKENEHVQESS